MVKSHAAKRRSGVKNRGCEEKRAFVDERVGKRKRYSRHGTWSWSIDGIIANKVVPKMAPLRKMRCAECHHSSIYVAPLIGRVVRN
jgi:hypothetical protein